MPDHIVDKLYGSCEDNDNDLARANDFFDLVIEHNLHDYFGVGSIIYFGDYIAHFQFRADGAYFQISSRPISGSNYTCIREQRLAAD